MYLFFIGNYFNLDVGHFFKLDLLTMNKRGDTLYDVDYFKHTANNHTCGDKTGMSQPQRFLFKLRQRVTAVSEPGRGGLCTSQRVGRGL